LEGQQAMGQYDDLAWQLSQTIYKKLTLLNTVQPIGTSFSQLEDYGTNEIAVQIINSNHQTIYVDPTGGLPESQTGCDFFWTLHYSTGVAPLKLAIQAKRLTPEHNASWAKFKYNAYHADQANDLRKTGKQFGFEPVYFFITLI
jgi:hypothetical protein